MTKVLENKEILDNLHKIVKHGKQFHSAQIVMLQLSRLVEKHPVMKKPFNEIACILGIDSRHEAFIDAAEEVADSYIPLDDGTHVFHGVDSSTAAKQGKIVMKHLLNDFSLQTAFVKLNLKTKGRYSTLKLSTAMTMVAQLYSSLQEPSKKSGQEA